jgi:hypothetical protein
MHACTLGCVWFPSLESRPASDQQGSGWPGFERTGGPCLLGCTGRACMHGAVVWLTGCMNRCRQIMQCTMFGWLNTTTFQSPLSLDGEVTTSSFMSTTVTQHNISSNLQYYMSFQTKITIRIWITTKFYQLSQCRIDVVNGRMLLNPFEQPEIM